MSRDRKSEQDAAIEKYRQAAQDMRNATSSEEWRDASDRLIDAQHEGLPSRFLMGWR